MHLQESGIVFYIYWAPGLRIRINFIRIQHFRLNTDPDRDPTDPDPGLYWPKIGERITAEKNVFLGSNTAIYLSLGLHKERRSYRSSKKRPSNISKHELLIIQHINIKTTMTMMQTLQALLFLNRMLNIKILRHHNPIAITGSIYFNI